MCALPDTALPQTVYSAPHGFGRDVRVKAGLERMMMGASSLAAFSQQAPAPMEGRLQSPAGNQPVVLTQLAPEDSQMTDSQGGAVKTPDPGEVVFMEGGRQVALQNSNGTGLFKTLMSAGGDLVITHLVLDLGGHPQQVSPMGPDRLASMLNKYKNNTNGAARGVFLFSTFPSLGDHMDTMHEKDYNVWTFLWHNPALSNQKTIPMTGATTPILIGVAGMDKPEDAWTMMSDVSGGAHIPVGRNCSATESDSRGAVKIGSATLSADATIMVSQCCPTFGTGPWSSATPC